MTPSPAPQPLSSDSAYAQLMHTAFDAGVVLEESLLQDHLPPVRAAINDALAALDAVIVAARSESFGRWASALTTIAADLQGAA